MTMRTLAAERLQTISEALKIFIDMEVKSDVL